MRAGVTTGLHGEPRDVLCTGMLDIEYIAWTREDDYLMNLVMNFL